MRKLAILTLGACLTVGTAALAVAQDNTNTGGSSAQSGSTTTGNDTNTGTTGNTGTDTGAMGTGNSGMNNTAGEGGADRSMPATNAGWLPMLLGGGTLTGLGLALRRR